MLDHRLAADVDDESDARANLGDVGEVLLRPDTNVGPTGCAELAHFVHNSQI
jgi:hypothetical protein